MSLRTYGLSAALMLTLTTLPAVTPSEPTVPPDARAVSATAASFASLEGRTIDLRNGWGAATACSTDGHTTQCWRTEAEMDAAIGAMPAPGTGIGTRSLATCSSSLRLYDGASFTGTVLAFVSTGSLINLSTYGFSNMTTSYKVGNCGALLYDGANGSGTQYPGNTSANSGYPAMVSGWNNRISSFYMF
jgi:hypothetical protein